MEDEFKNTTNPRDPDCYCAPRPARPGVPPANAADDIALAIENLMKKNAIDNLMPKPRWRVSNQWRGFPPGIQGMISANPTPTFRYTVFDGHQMKRGGLGSIEDLFEGFIDNLEWENE